MAVTSMLSCEGVKKLGAFKIPCCEYCHDHQRFHKKDHYLHQTHLGVLSQNAPGLGWCCCVVDHHIHTPKWKVKQATTAANTYVVNTSAVTTSAGLQWTQQAHEQLTASEKNYEAIQQIVDQHKEQLAEAVAKNTPLLEHVKVVPGPVLLCDDPLCEECTVKLEKYWSVKLQGWLDHSDYQHYNETYALDLEHPYIEGHGVCAPGSHNHPSKDWKIVPEWAAYMCLNAVGQPTFGVKYCANPCHCAVVMAGPQPSLFLTISTGYKVSDYVPVDYMQYVTHVNYLPPKSLEPPF